MGRPGDAEKRRARDEAARYGLALGLRPHQIAALPAFADLTLSSAAVEAYAAVRRVKAAANGTAAEPPAPPDPEPDPTPGPWGLPELLAYLTQLAEVAAGLSTAADLGALAACLDPGAAARAADACRELAAELGRRRDFELRLAERIFLAHEVLARRAERG